MIFSSKKKILPRAKVSERVRAQKVQLAEEAARGEASEIPGEAQPAISDEKGTEPPATGDFQKKMGARAEKEAAIWDDYQTAEDAAAVAYAAERKAVAEQQGFELAKNPPN